MVEAGQESTAAGLLSAFDFLNAKVATGLTFDLVRDYASVSEALGIQGRSTTAQFHAWNLFVIQQSHHLSRFPLHFTQQVINADDLAVAQSLLSMSSIPEIGKAERPYLHRLYKPPIEEDQPWVQTFAGRTASISSVACDQDGLIDVTDDEWAFVAPYLTLMTEAAPQREHSMREVFNGLRWMIRTGAPWRMIPNDLPPWHTVYQQSMRWIKAECFIAMVHDLREMLRVAQGRAPQPTAAIFDGRTLQSTPESGARAGYDGAKRRKGSKVHIAVDTLGHLLALHVTPANEQERAQVAELVAQVQEATEQNVTLAYVDQGYTGPDPAEAAAAQGIRLEVVKLPEAKKGFVLLPHRWVVERSFAWAARFRRLARDYERLPETLAGLHYVVFAVLMLAKAAKLLQSA